MVIVVETYRRNEGELANATDGELEPNGQYGITRLDERGRLTIPEELRDDLSIGNGTEFTVVREGNDIHLVRRLPELETLTRGGTWGEEAFRDAGEATFGGSLRER